MIQHIVLLKWKSGTRDEQVLETFARAEPLARDIPGVESLTIGRNRVDQDHGFTHALIVRLADEQALERYLAHPLRKSYVDEQLGPIEDQRIEIDVPVDMTLRRDPEFSWEWGAGMGTALPYEP